MKHIYYAVSLIQEEVNQEVHYSLILPGGQVIPFEKEFPDFDGAPLSEVLTLIPNFLQDKFEVEVYSVNVIAGRIIFFGKRQTVQILDPREPRNWQLK